jgi:hypothetical protein
VPDTNSLHSSGERRGFINRGDLVDCWERLGSTPRWSTKSRWPEGIRGFAYEANSRWFDSTQRVQISRGRWISAGALRRRFAAVRFCLASPDMPPRPRWRGKSLVRTRCRVQFPGAAPICPVSIAGDAAVLYTDDTAFDSPTGLQFCRESIDGDAPDSYPG